MKIISRLNLKKVVIFVIFFVLGMYFFFFFLCYNDMKKQKYQLMDELSHKVKDMINEKFARQTLFLEQAVHYISKGSFKNDEEILKFFNDDFQKNGFYNFAILHEDGSGKTNKGETIKNYSNVKDFLSKEETSLFLNQSLLGDEQIAHVISKTFSFRGKPCVMIAEFDFSEFGEGFYQNEGGMYFITNQGEILFDSFGFLNSQTNFCEYMKGKNMLQSDFAKIEQLCGSSLALTSTFEARIHHKNYMFHYEPIFEGIYFVSVIESSYLSIHLFSYCALFFFFVSLLIFGFLVVRRYEKKVSRLQKEIYLDPISGLYNEAYFYHYGDSFLKKYDQPLYCFTLDINQFEVFNQSFGSDFSKEILRVLGASLKEVLPKDCLLCRFSHDVFGGLFNYDEDIEDLISIIIRHCSSLVIFDRRVDLYFSIGICPFTSSLSLDALFLRAELSRQQVKGLYDHNYYIYDDVLDNQVSLEKEIESSMQYALLNCEFKVYYQPKVSATYENIVGAEALVRWYRNGKLIYPNDFIPLFEKNKFICKLDLYVFEAVCKDIASWLDEYGVVPHISVNVSKEHFAKENFIDDYLTIMYQYGVSKEMIELEITESAIGSESDIITHLVNLREEGFILSLDDFGTGSSSLNMLQNIPVDFIKIDKSFIDTANLNIDKNIINYIVVMALQLGVKTVVEGVETKEQAEYVKKMGCDIIQGFYYSKPLSKEDFEKYFYSHKKKR